MKTTNYEISKKLKEIGFEAESDFYWYCYDKGQEMRHIADADGKGSVKAYYLETLLDALPDSITREYKSNKDGTIKEFEEKLLIDKRVICYRCYDIETSDEANEFWREYEYQQNISISSRGDSLANTAGKMLINLFEAGLIKFNK